MKDTITQQLDDKDMEYVIALKRIGFDSCTAKTIVALIPCGKTQHELIGCTGLYQSTISIALKKLVNKNYVIVSELLHTEGRGRPKLLYTLKSWDDIIDEIEKRVIREAEDKNAQIARLKELVH